MGHRRNYEFSKHIRLQDGYMYCEDVCVKTLQDRLKEQLDQPSPVYMYSKQQFIDNIMAYRSALDRCGLKYILGYSLKANHSTWALNTAISLGCSPVTVSGNETRLALLSMMAAEKTKSTTNAKLGRDIIANGNGKQTWEIELAVKNDCLINVDSQFDLKHISEVTKRLKKTARILLRLNPDIDPRVHEYLATGLAASKFGLDEDSLAEALTWIPLEPRVKLVGIHCHIGSTIDNVNVFNECLDVMTSKFDEIKQRGFTDLKYINLGGGLGINYRKHAWRTEENGDSCGSQQHVMPTPGDLIEKVHDRLLSRDDICLILEPGRSLIGSAVTLLTKVIGCKQTRQIKYMVVDAAMTEAIRPALYGAYHHIELTEPTAGQHGNTDVTRATNSHSTTISHPPLIQSICPEIPEQIVINTPLQHKEGDDADSLNGIDEAVAKQTVEVSRDDHYREVDVLGGNETCSQPRRVKYDVVGPVCECGDFLGKDRWLPVPHEGCGVAIFDTGAYCASMSSNYNLRMRPAEVLVDGSDWSIIRHPDQLSDLLNMYKY